MKRISTVLTLIVLMPLMGCAVKQQAWGDPQTGLVLSYRMPDDQTLRYRLNFEQTHSMEAMGQAREFGADKALEVSMTSDSSGEGSHQLTITVDSLHLRLDTPRGEVAQEIIKVLGGSFGMVLSSLGDESGFSEISEVAYEMQPAGWMNVATDFEAFFPNLPEGPIVVGDNWATTQSLKDTAFNSAQKINLESVHTFAGIETIDDMECVKITTRMNGALEELGERMTRAPEMTARFEGTGVWYFAYEKGLVVRTSMTLRGAGDMKPNELRGMPRKMQQIMTTDTRLLP